MPRVLSETGPVPWARSIILDTPEPEPLGDQLKGLFDQLSEGPMPSRLVDLADALEDAFQRGELYAPCAKKRPSRR